MQFESPTAFGRDDLRNVLELKDPSELPSPLKKIQASSPGKMKTPLLNKRLKAILGEDTTWTGDHRLGSPSAVFSNIEASERLHSSSVRLRASLCLKHKVPYCLYADETL